MQRGKEKTKYDQLRFECTIWRKKIISHNYKMLVFQQLHLFSEDVTDYAAFCLIFSKNFIDYFLFSLM